MRLAWFRPDPSQMSDGVDDVAPLVDELARAHDVERFDDRRAHDFVWMQARQPFDLAVFELDDTAAHHFIWPYALHYPGVLHLRRASLHDSRAAALRRAKRCDDYATERAFGPPDLVRAPVLASRVVVVNDAHLSRQLRAAYPLANIRHAPIGVGVAGEIVERAAFSQGGLTCAIIPSTPSDVVHRAVTRATQSGAPVRLVNDSTDRVFRESDAILTLSWPPTAETIATALTAMAHRRVVVFFETEVTAGWPAVDPQTWRPRVGSRGDPPIGVSIDPRDAEHSLAVTLRRLAADSVLRRDLAAAAHAWWLAHATRAHASEAWQRILAEAVALDPPPRPHDWPSHLTADGTERARAILAEMGTSVDFLT